MKLKAKGPSHEPQTLRLKLPSPLAHDLQDYAVFFKETHRQDITLPELIEAILSHFMTSDREFTKFQRTKTSQNGATS